MDIYEINGYLDRHDYLEHLADDYGVDFDVICAFADLFGESEDFDGLVCALQDYNLY